MIPGAAKAADSALIGDGQCAQNGGLGTAAGTAATGKTVCSKVTPFRVEFHSDAWEHATIAASDEIAGSNVGFKLRYFQTTC